MRRLLWKEWHEIRWYLIGLVLGPWLLSLRTSTYFPQGRSYVLNSTSGKVAILLLIMVFWGATRLSGENRAGRLTIRNLPVNQWTVLAAKFLPGFIVACLMPLWIHAVVVLRFHPDFFAPGFQPATCIWENFLTMVCAYLVSFALSTCTSTAVAVIAAIGILMFGSQSLGNYRNVDVGQAFFAMASLFAIPMLRIKAGIAGAGRKAAIGVISVLLTIPIFLGLFYIYFIANWPRPNPDLSVFWATLTGRYDYFYPSYPELADWGQPVASADRMFLAYAYASRRDVRNYRKGRMAIALKVWDFRHSRSLLEVNDSVPIAWLPDGSLLLLTYGTTNADLIEWNQSTGDREELLSYPCSPKRCPIMRVLPSPDGSKIALFITPRRSQGIDLWMLDRRSGKMKLVRPGLGSWGDRDAAWEGDRLVFRRNYDEYWSMKSDGSDLRRIKLGGPLCADF